MTDRGKASRIDLFSFATPQMRAFHMSWFAFFTVFFAWFGIAPLMPVVREDLGLTQAQVGNTIVASVAATVLARLLVGPLCDRFGPRRTYATLLVLGSIPVMTVGLASSYEGFLLFRLAIGAIGAAFVITQVHTSLMFGPGIVGTANATTAGWGNLGGGVTQMAMPLLLAAVLMLGVGEGVGWRLAMVIPGVLLLLVGIAYYLLTQDTPDGDLKDLRGTGRRGAIVPRGGMASFLEAARDRRVWALFVVYGACFGVELTINNVAVLYFHDRFSLGLAGAGLVAGLFGLTNVFARTLGGYFSDRAGLLWGLNGRVKLLFALLVAEGVALMLFARMGTLGIAIAAMLVFSVFVQMAEGATFGVVPFVNPRALGGVAGIVGAGGNAGAVAAGLLFGIESFSMHDALFFLGVAVTVASLAALLVRFAIEVEVVHPGPVAAPVGRVRRAGEMAGA